jgi:photosystem II stability/assembly factor-like uncharacterized protein
MIYFICVLLFASFTILDAQVSGSWKRLLDFPVYGIGINPKNPETIIVGGLGRTLYKTQNGGLSWTIDSIEFRSGSSQLTNILISSVDTNIVLAGGVFNSIRRSTDQGITWENVFEPEKPLFISPGETIIENPDNPLMIYAGDNTSNRIFRSMNGGISWDTITTLNVSGLCTLTLKPDSSNVLFAGCKLGIIKKSTDAGSSWRTVASIREKGDSEIPKIVFSKKNPSIGFAIIAYFLPKNKPNGGIYKTTDGGETWNEFGSKDTSFWSLCTAQYQNGNEELFIGGYSDASENIPGPGFIIQSQINVFSPTYYSSQIPWFSNMQGIPPRKNVWMIKSAINRNGETLVYAATEAGFYVWKPTSTAIHNEPLFDQSIEFSVAESFVHIESAKHEIQSIGVFSLSGKQIYVPTISAQSQATIPLSSIHESIIIIRVFTQKGTFSEILIAPHHNAMLTREAIIE